MHEFPFFLDRRKLWFESFMWFRFSYVWNDTLMHDAHSHLADSLWVSKMFLA